MKKLIIAITLLSTLVVNLHAELSFDKKNYTKKWETSQGDVSLKEYFAGSETTENWATMISFQAHPNAKEIKEVSGPYYEARKSIIALQPELHYQKEGDSSDLIVELLLGAPGYTPHIEFVLSRFIKTENGVFMAVYSHKIKLKSNKKNQNINFNEIMENKEKWIKELLEIPITSITEAF